MKCNHIFTALFIARNITFNEKEFRETDVQESSSFVIIGEQD
jgi:hypothetical protein